MPLPCISSVGSKRGERVNNYKELAIMFQKVRDAFGGLDTLSVDKSGNSTDSDLKLAAAVVLLEIAQVDGNYSQDEGTMMFKSLEKEFGLTSDSAHKLLALAEQNVRGREQVDEYIEIINTFFDDTQKQRILGMVWKIISADGITTERESGFAVRLREKLNLSMEQALRARKIAEGGIDLTKEESAPLGRKEE